MLHVFSRTEGLSGTEKRKSPDQLKVAVFGIGTVGSYAVEALARAGVGTLILVDYGEVSAKKLNRQIVALRSTIGKKKVQVEKVRIMDINENAIVHTYETFLGEDTIDLFDFSSYDYVVDAMDHVPAKLLLLKQMRKFHTPIITCMGIGNAWNPSCFRIADFSKTVNLPFMRKIRQELKIQKAKYKSFLFYTGVFQKETFCFERRPDQCRYTGEQYFFFFRNCGVYDSSAGDFRPDRMSHVRSELFCSTS